MPSPTVQCTSHQGSIRTPHRPPQRSAKLYVGMRFGGLDISTCVKSRHTKPIRLYTHARTHLRQAGHLSESDGALKQMTITWRRSKPK